MAEIIDLKLTDLGIIQYHNKTGTSVLDICGEQENDVLQRVLDELVSYKILGSVEDYAKLKQDKDSYYTTFDGLREMIHELAGKLADYEEQAEMVNLLKTDGERRGNNE